LRSPANSSDRATRSALVQPNLLQELRNFGRFCGMGGLLSIHLRPAFSVEGQVGMSTSICSPGWGTGRSSAATSTPYKNLGKFDRARWDMAPTGSPSTHAQGPSLRLSGRPHEHSRHRPSRRDLRELVYNGLHDRSAGNGHYSGPSPFDGQLLGPRHMTSVDCNFTRRQERPQARLVQRAGSLHATACATWAAGTALYRRSVHRTGAPDQR